MSVPRVRERIFGPSPHRRVARADVEWPDLDWSSEKDNSLGDWDSWSPTPRYDWTSWTDNWSDWGDESYDNDIEDEGASDSFISRNGVMIAIIAPIACIILFIFLCRSCAKENDDDIDIELEHMPSSGQATSRESNLNYREPVSSSSVNGNTGIRVRTPTSLHSDRQSNNSRDIYDIRGPTMDIHDVEDSYNTRTHLDLSAPPQYDDTFLIRENSHGTGSHIPEVNNTLANQHDDAHHNDNEVNEQESLLNEARISVEPSFSTANTREAQPPPPDYETVMANFDQYQ